LNEKVKPQPMTIDDLQALYSELRGSRSAPAIMDARAFFLERQMQDAHAKLNEAYETYSESRQRILRQDPETQVDAKAKDRDQQIRRLKRKQAKAREIIESLEDYLGQLKRLADKEKAREDSKSNATNQPTATEGLPADAETDSDAVQRNVVKKDSLDDEMLKQFSGLIGDRQLDFVSSRYDFRPLTQVADVQTDAVYLYRKGDRCLLINAEFASAGDTELTCADVCKPTNRIQLSPNAMVKLSVKRQIVLLLEK
jgi:hypothetical protein